MVLSHGVYIYVRKYNFMMDKQLEKWYCLIVMRDDRWHLSHVTPHALGILVIHADRKKNCLRSEYVRVSVAGVNKNKTKRKKKMK